MLRKTPLGMSVPIAYAFRTSESKDAITYALQILKDERGLLPIVRANRLMAEGAGHGAEEGAVVGGGKTARG